MFFSSRSGCVQVIRLETSYNLMSPLKTFLSAKSCVSDVLNHAPPSFTCTESLWAVQKALGNSFVHTFRLRFWLPCRTTLRNYNCGTKCWEPVSPAFFHWQAILLSDTVTHSFHLSMYTNLQNLLCRLLFIVLIIYHCFVGVEHFTTYKRLILVKMKKERWLYFTPFDFQIWGMTFSHKSRFWLKRACMIPILTCIFSFISLTPLTYSMSSAPAELTFRFMERSQVCTSRWSCVIFKSRHTISEK